MTIEPLGGIGAIVKTASALLRVVWVLGLFDSAGVAIAAWWRTHRHQALAAACSVAANELAAIRSLMGWQRMEQSRAAFVRDAEVISREHSLWPSSRRIRAGVPA